MFRIDEAARILNNSGEFMLRRYEKTNDSENWVAFKPVILLGREVQVQINIMAIFSQNQITFLTPIHGDGSEGVTGERSYVLDSIMHNFNFHSRGGYLTKYADDNSNAIVFMYHLALSKMDFSWFRYTLLYCVDAIVVFRPLIDSIINNLGLKFDSQAGINDFARRYLEQHASQFMNLLPKGNI